MSSTVDEAALISDCTAYAHTTERRYTKITTTTKSYRDRGVTGESRLEAYIKAFVLKKTAEKVDLHLKQTISIKPLLKRGSVAVAIFWANALQHKDNFPSRQFPYKDLKDKTTGASKLILKAEDMTFTVWMDTGTLMIQGSCVYEWFARRFKEILDNFDPEFESTWHFKPDSRPTFPPEEKEEPYDMASTEEYMLMLTKQHSYNDVLEKKVLDHVEEIIPDLAKLSIEQDIFEGEDLAQELETLSQGQVRDGQEYVYKIWKSLLNKWFSDDNAKVYLATPFLDSERLVNIIDIFLKHRPKGDIETFYLRRQCDEMGKKVAGDVKREALKKFDPKQQTLIEYKVLRKMIYPIKRFHCKFMAAIKDDQAEVLITSANFHGNHFECQNMETVLFTVLPAAEFIEKYVDPIASPVVATT